MEKQLTLFRYMKKIFSLSFPLSLKVVMIGTDMIAIEKSTACSVPCGLRVGKT